MESKSRKMRVYTQAQKELLIDQVIKGGRSMNSVSKEHDVPLGTLAKWVTDRRNGVANSTRTASEIEAENSRLRAECVRLKAERDILKKATAYFAKESL